MATEYVLMKTKTKSKTSAIWSVCRSNLVQDSRPLTNSLSRLESSGSLSHWSAYASQVSAMTSPLASNSATKRLMGAHAPDHHPTEQNICGCVEALLYGSPPDLSVAAAFYLPLMSAHFWVL